MKRESDRRTALELPGQLTAAPLQRPRRPRPSSIGFVLSVLVFAATFCIVVGLAAAWWLR